MATSGTYTFNLTISQFLDRVLRLAGVTGENETPNASQYAYALEALNLQQQQLEVNDVPLWKRGFHEFQPQTSSFVTNAAAPDPTTVYRCIKGHTATADTEPGVGNLWELYWVGATTTLTPTSWALTNLYVTSIEFTLPDRFYDVLYITAVQNSGNEVQIPVISFHEYTTKLNSKRTSTSTVLPTDIAFDNLLETNTGFIYPQPTEVFESKIRVYGVIKPEDAEDVSDNIDIPVRYINMLSYAVALDLAVQYQRDDSSIMILSTEKARYIDEYKKSDIEFTETSIGKGAY